MNTPQTFQRPASIGEAMRFARCRRDHVTRAISTGALPVIAENISARGRTPRWLIDQSELLHWVARGRPLVKAGV